MGATWKPNPEFTKNTRDTAAAKAEAESEKKEKGGKKAAAAEKK